LEDIFNLKAVSATLIGIVSSICFISQKTVGIAFLLSIVGIICGVYARRETRNSKLSYVGTLINILCFGICIIGFTLYVVTK